MENKSLYKAVLPHRAVKVLVRVVVAAVLIVLCIYLESLDSVLGIFNSYSASPVYYYWLQAVVLSGVYGSYFIAVMTTIPFSGNFCTEYQQGCWRYVLARTGTVRYTIRKFFLVFLSGGAPAALGGWLFVAVTSRLAPFVELSNISQLRGLVPFIDLLEDKPLLYFAIAFFLFFLMGGLYACLGYTVSAFVPRSYVVYGVPFVFLFALERFYIATSFPDKWRLDFWLSGWMAPAGGLRFLGMATLRVLVICVAAGFLFHKKLKWRLEHE